MLLTPLLPVTNCHTFSDPLLPLKRDVLYGRPRSSNAIGPQCRGLQICDLMRSYNFFSFLSNYYTHPNTTPKTLTAGILTLTYHHDAFESFCAPVFCDFIRNYSGTYVGPLDTSNIF